MQPAAKKPRVDGMDGKGKDGANGGGNAEPHPPQQQQQQQQRKKQRPLTPEKQARAAIHMAAKANDLPAALAVFDRAKAEGVKLGTELYVSLLYLCSGGDAWEQQLRQARPPPPAQQGARGAERHDAGAGAAAGEQGQAAAGSGDAVAAAAAGAGAELQQQAQQAQEAQEAPCAEQLDGAARRARAQQLFEEMRQSGGRLALNEMCYTAQARLAAADGDADRAFAVAQASRAAPSPPLPPEMVAAGVAPKLRSFTPALIAYAEAGECAKAFEVDAAIAAHQLDLGEPEFGRLVQAAAAGASWAAALGVLRRIGAELTTLQPASLARVAALFASPTAARAFEGVPGGGRWEVGPAAVDGAGRCSRCGGRLAALDLSGEELRQFAQGIAAIAERQERRPNDFKQFKCWLEEHGPFGAVVDGANVALYGQNFDSGGFNFGQIRAVCDHLASRHPDLKPLLLLNVGRTKAAQARAPAAQALMRELGEAKSFYVTPAGSNDDWYWIYAAVTAGERGLLVSNDEMRDHIFQLDYPAPYTTCAQELECGSWVFPGADGSWLCARRASGAAPAAAEAAEARPAAAEAD
ncbi:hypothetical protein CHLNCDRAFT_145111 [Chlorella variabilis]|uniref:Mitochondrial ribonuclease P catalytic subunit n=1 Tax=Chlorella variabilis TaxID=554065 RepID=E1ZCL4_CHLVA|nr:hypothetical protein CHLNCDRAFT_145111 [Chlorella variabilis]EFN56261.1 hypothetical protein CHLNCDRAFT_145111 [Chlorella variabilis]|eukprot:XP_005848363.1 hypothetical protein CHLNCDRAFT_145111 [Chlorella variabilis]